MTLRSHQLLAQRQPLELLEAAVVDRHLARPQDAAGPVLDALRYVIGFAKMSRLRDAEGRDHEVGEMLAPLAGIVRDQLQARLGSEEPTLWAAVRVLPELVKRVREHRARIEEHFGVDRASIDREVCQRHLILVLGGGGGAGYGYSGIFNSLDHNGLRPSLICGTSIGSLLGLFRARSRELDPSGLAAVNERMTWQNCFSVVPEPSRYGLPATLNLYLRRVIADFLRRPDGQVATMADLAIPMHIVATGLKMDALKHDLSYYEHALDDVVGPQMGFRLNAMGGLARLADIFREFAANPQSLVPVVFGRDEGTGVVDCVDAAGFSSSVPGLLHYDVHRDDPRMKHVLDQLYADRGITRLTEGGVVDNVPCRIGFKSAMEGRLDGLRNHYILALDCFPPKPSSLVLYPIQQIARANVVRNIPYAHTWIALNRTLSPVNLVPTAEHVSLAGRWAIEELRPHLPRIVATMKPVAPLA